MLTTFYTGFLNDVFLTWSRNISRNNNCDATSSKPEKYFIVQQKFFENKQNIFSQPYFLLSKIFWVVKLESSPMVKKKVRCIFEIPVFDRLLLVLYSSGKSPLSTS